MAISVLESSVLESIEVSAASSAVKPASSSAAKPAAYVPEFALASCGVPSQWNRQKSTSFWNKKVKREFQKRREQPGKADIDTFLQFLAIRPDAEGKPISQKLGPATFENNG